MTLLGEVVGLLEADAIWDVRELLHGGDAGLLIETVEGELRVLPVEMRAAWTTARS